MELAYNHVSVQSCSLIWFYTNIIQSDALNLFVLSGEFSRAKQVL